MAFQTFRLSPPHSLLCRNGNNTKLSWQPLSGSHSGEEVDWSVKSEIQDSSDREGPCALWTAQSRKKKALGLLVTFTVHLKRKNKVSLLGGYPLTLTLMHGSTLLLCVKRTGVSKAGRYLRGPQKLPAQEGCKPHCPPCVHICEQQLTVLREVGFSSQNGL